MQLYKISFTSTDKVYIGITSKTAEHRFKEHCKKTNKSAIARAIRKHDGVKLSILAECDDWELLALAEIEAIDKYNSVAPNGYNISHGGDGALGFERSPETRAKIAAAGRGRIQTPEQRLKNSEAQKGKLFSEETRAKISAANKGKKRTPETRALISSIQTGRKLSAEHRAKISAGNKNPSEETRLKKSIASKNRSKEAHDKIVSALFGRKVSDETKAKISASLNGKKHTDERCANIAKAKRANAERRKLEKLLANSSR